MAERIISLSIDTLFDGDHNHPAVPDFIADFSGCFYAGEGKMPMMMGSLDIDSDFPLRLLVGIPQRTLSREKRLIAEAYCATITGRAEPRKKGLWCYNKGWCPTNPGRVAAPLQESRLDTEWMLALGISAHVWKNKVLFSSTALSQEKKQANRATIMRYFFALVAFGFSDPYQFFTATDGA